MTNKSTLKARSHCVYSILYHLVIVTKYRKKVLTAPMLDEIRALVTERAVARDGEIIEINGEADHVHILVSLPPHIAVSDFINVIKTNTSRLLRSKYQEQLASAYKDNVLWSRSYCVLTSGGAPLEVLKKYIQNQDSPD